TRDKILKHFETLWPQVNVQVHDARDVATRTGKTLDEPHLHGIATEPSEDNRDTGGRQLRGLRRWNVRGEDEIHPLLDQIARRGWQCSQIPLGEADTEDKLLVLAISQFQQPVSQGHYRWCRSPRLRQRSDPERLSTLSGVCSTAKQHAAHQEHHA